MQIHKGSKQHYIKEYSLLFPSLSGSLQALSEPICTTGCIEVPVPQYQTVAITRKHASFKSNIYCLKLQILLLRHPRSMKKPLFASGNQHGHSRVCAPCSCTVQSFLQDEILSAVCVYSLHIAKTSCTEFTCIWKR